MFILTVLYMLVNLAYLRGLGLAGMARSQAVAADLLEQVWGSAAARMISVMIAVSALTRSTRPSSSGRGSSYALGCDWAVAWLPRPLERTHRFADAGTAAARGRGAGADRVRRVHAPRLRDDGRLHRTGVLAVFPAHRDRAVRAALARARSGRGRSVCRSTPIAAGPSAPAAPGCCIPALPIRAWARWWAWGCSPPACRWLRCAAPGD